MIAPHDYIDKMSPYALAKLDPPPGKSLMSLSQNESLRPPSPRAIAAATKALQNCALYPDPDWHDLRHGLAQLHGIDADGILCGNGSLDLIGCLARAYTGPGRAVLIPEHAYPFFRTAAQMAHARIDTATERGTTVCVEALLKAVREDTALVCVANPGNPTGTRIPGTELRRLRAGLPETTLLVIDEAYGEFADHLSEPVFDMVAGGSTIILRTFSKAYGLAGMRVGWGLFPADMAGTLRKVMNPNGVTLASQAAAMAALADQDHMRETCALTAELKDFAVLRLGQLGLHVQPSHTNFVLIELEDADAARQADATLRREGIFLRGQGGAGLGHCLRMTIGDRRGLLAAIGVFERLHLGKQS